MDEKRRYTAVLCSREDAASMNIKEHLMGLGTWKEEGAFRGTPVLWSPDGGTCMVTFDEPHLYVDGIDRDIERAIGRAPALLVFASRHRSAAGKKSLTVHPIGNHGHADFGGRDGTLVPSAPVEMTACMRFLHARAKALALDFSVGYEVTHHGPLVATPTFYIEIGSSSAEWGLGPPAVAIAETVHRVIVERNVPTAGGPVAIGIGGGHYAPRFTDVALAARVDFGHMIPNYALENYEKGVVARAVAATPSASVAYIHRKSMKTALLHEVEKDVEGSGLRVVREKDLVPL